MKDVEVLFVDVDMSGDVPDLEKHSGLNDVRKFVADGYDIVAVCTVGRYGNHMAYTMVRRVETVLAK